jgi:hypothetical protein
MPASSASECEGLCVPIELGGRLQPDRNRLGSAFGRVDACLPGEHWPTCREKPLWPLCQLNLTEAPWRPESLADIELLALFVPNPHDVDYIGEICDTTYASAPGEAAGWCVRTYGSLEALVPLIARPHSSTIRESQVRYGKVTADFECGDDLHIHGSKLGGWPSIIPTTDPPWLDEGRADVEFLFAFQIFSESEASWDWGNDGRVYFARSKDDPRKWTFEFWCS